jgi:hypothetical protein
LEWIGVASIKGVMVGRPYSILRCESDLERCAAHA